MSNWKQWAAAAALVQEVWSGGDVQAHQPTDTGNAGNGVQAMQDKASDENKSNADSSDVARGQQERRGEAHSNK